MDNKEKPEQQQKIVETDSSPKKRKPDELSGLNVEARIKIFDPETGKIYLQGRA